MSAMHFRILCSNHDSALHVEDMLELLRLLIESLQDMLTSVSLEETLDGLQVEIRNEKEVWVKFQNFQTGHSEKIPVA